MALGLRHRRLHRRFIQDAVTAMCAQVADETAAGPTLGLSRLADIAAVLAAQEAMAEQLDTRVRTRLLAGDRTAAGRPLADDLIETIAELRGSTPPAGTAVSVPIPRTRPLGPVPRLDGTTGLAAWLAQVHDTVATQIRVARTVLRHAAGWGLPPDDCRQRLTGALDSAATALRDAADVAEQGRLIDAVRAVSQIDLPLAEHGVPGDGGRRDLQLHEVRGSELAAQHRFELLGWCTHALRHCDITSPAAQTRGSV